MTVYEVAEAVVDGRRVVVLVPLAAESPDEEIALLIRAAATASGRCACGATSEVVEVRDGIRHAVMAHENECPAVSAAAARAIERTERRTDD